MGNNKVSAFDTHLGLLDRKPVDGNTYSKMLYFTRSCLLLLANSLLLFFRFIARQVFRIKKTAGPRRDETSGSELRDWKPLMEENNERRMPMFSFKYQNPNQNLAEKAIVDEEEEKDLVVDGTPDTTIKANETHMTSADIHNYRFSPEKDFSGFIEEQEAMTFGVHESFSGFEEDNNFEEGDLGIGFLSAEDFLKPKVKSISEGDAKSDEFWRWGSLQSSGDLEEVRNLKCRLFGEKSNSMCSETTSASDREVKFNSDGFSGFDFDSCSASSSDGYSVKELDYDSDIDDFLSEKDFDDSVGNSETRETSSNSIKRLEQLNMESFTLQRSDYEEEEAEKDDDDNIDYVHDVDDDKTSDFVYEEGYKKLLGQNLVSPVHKELFMGTSPAQKKSSGNPEFELELQGVDLKLLENGNSDCSPSSAVHDLLIEFVEDSSDEELSSVKSSFRLESLSDSLPVKDVGDQESKAEVLEKELGKVADDGSSCESNSLSNASKVWKLKDEGQDENKKDSEEKWKAEESMSQDFDDEQLDELWEHQDLIEQLKMELKKVRAVGLPTIFEESESPRAIEDLKPFNKIDEKFRRQDSMDELQKFYRSYRERMRKLDVLNYQKMYAMGFLQVKEPLQSIWVQRPLFSTFMTHLSQNFLPFCHRTFNKDPSEKLIKDLQCDLEAVYVGQTCLSWEFLRWQYEKSREMPESDPRRRLQYNQVAGEFQQFQVLLQRFTENEPFHGPRLPNYVKQRCVRRSLLQVPIMKEDCLNENMEKKESDYVITSEMLEDIMEEAIRIFWEFVKVEKHETPAILKALLANQVEVQDPTDYEFIDDIQADLQKKDKKLKDLLRTGNCIVKKFKKPQEDRSNQELFFSQVDLKLVSRVLRMSRITSDQLRWCHKKLSKITFSERKLHREPSFLLFPC